VTIPQIAQRPISNRGPDSGAPSSSTTCR
jgi:hypothetical protein